MPQISKEEFQQWLLNPVTKALKERFNEDRERLKEAWANGAYEGSRELDSKVRGQCEVISQLLAFNDEDMKEEE